MTQAETRDVAINLRARAAQRSLIDRAAEALGRNRSDFMLEAACDKAKEVLLEQTFFALDEQSFTRFRALLDRPLPKKNRAALHRLLARKATWEAGE